MTLRTARLLLRELTPNDVHALNDIDRDPRVTRYMSYETQSLDQSREYLDGCIRDQTEDPRRKFDLAIVPHGSPALVGRCGFHISRPEHREAMIWYVLHPENWGRGFAHESVSALIDFAFESLGLHRVWADCDPRNSASCRLAERLGMTLEGRLRENYWLKNEWCDSAVYGLLDREWRARKV